jgi:hypothetical protein
MISRSRQNDYRFAPLLCLAVEGKNLLFCVEGSAPSGTHIVEFHGNGAPQSDFILESTNFLGAIDIIFQVTGL